MKCLFICCLFLLLPGGLPLRAVPAEKKPYLLSEEEVRSYDAVQKKLDPATLPLLRRLKRAFPGKHEWTEYEVEALKKSGKPAPMPYAPQSVQQTGRAPRDTFPSSDADRYLLVAQKKQKSEENLPEVLRTKYGKQEWYTAEQVRDVTENGAASRMIEGARDKDDPIYIAGKKMRTFRTGFRVPRIRESWQDVLYDEDPSQPDRAGKVIGDLTGASLSLSHDGKSGSDTLSATGAVIFPWQYERSVAGGWNVEKLAIAPSVSINRVDVSDDPTAGTDELLYRLGVYANWRFPTEAGSGVQIRGAAVYATDTHGDGEVPGFELEIEPRWRTPYFPLGYRQILKRKSPLYEDGSDVSALDYQLRAWLRVEGGDVQRAGASWNPVEGDFLRLGPSVQLRVNAPRLLVGRDVSLTALYSRLYAQEGPKDHGSYFKATAAWNLYKNEYNGSRISLNVNYQKGDLDFTKDEVDSLTVGLGFLF